MSYLNERPRKTLDLASLLQICPNCLGDLDDRSDFAGEYYLCLHCGSRSEPRNRLGRLLDLSVARDADFAAIRDDPYQADHSLSRIA
jgi:hypothetical protein